MTSEFVPASPLAGIQDRLSVLAALELFLVTSASPLLLHSSLAFEVGYLSNVNSNSINMSY